MRSFKLVHHPTACRLAIVVSFGAIWALTISAGAAEAADLEWDTTIRYEVDTDRGTVRLTSEIEVTNDQANTRSGNTITRWFFSEIVVTVPNEATGISAEGDRGGVTFDVGPLGPAEEPTKEVTIRFERNLFYRSTQQMSLGFDLKGSPPRSHSTFRVNSAYASFPILAWGDEGRTSVEVVVDDRFDTSIVGGDFATTDGDGVTVYTDDAIADPSEYYAFVTLRDDDALRAATVDHEGGNIVVRAWPNDAIWSQLVSRAARDGTSELQALVGQDWAVEGDLEIVESFDPTLAGYGGWYLTDSDLIEIGEWADSHLVVHELSHSWFNSDLFGERWINEGLAEVYAEEAVERADLLATTDAERPQRASTTDLFSFPLTDWGDLLTGTEGDAPREDYGYETSWFVMGTILDEIGFDAMALALDAAARDRIAYQGSPDPEPVDPYDGWKRFLDLVEEVGGAESARDLFATYVVAEDEDLDERYETRAAYDRLRDDAGPCALPIYIRQPMSDWEFATAEERIAEARGVLDHRTAAAEEASASGLAAPDPGCDEFARTSDGFSAIHARLDDVDRALAVVTETDAAVEADRGLITRIGLMGTDLPAEMIALRAAYEAAAFGDVVTTAAAIQETLDDADRVGTRRAAFGGGGLLVLVLLIAGAVFGLRRHGRLRRARSVTEADPSGSFPS